MTFTYSLKPSFQMIYFLGSSTCFQLLVADFVLKDELCRLSPNFNYSTKVSPLSVVLFIGSSQSYKYRSGDDEFMVRTHSVLYYVSGVWIMERNRHTKSVDITTCSLFFTLLVSIITSEHLC